MKKWTNESVARLSGENDPVDEVRRRVRKIVFDAIDDGWSGPPFDPVALAQRLDIQVVPNDDVRDARLITREGKTRIEFNPNRPRGRARYSIAHEIGHTIFPDFADRIRNRTAHHDFGADEWQLEALCNIAAAEIVMPVGSLEPLSVADVSIEKLMEARKKFDVSAEAFLIRCVEASDDNVAMFCASRIESGSSEGRYRVDYSISSPTWSIPSRRSFSLLPLSTVVRECTAIGYTATGVESWVGDSPLRVECVGIPPYPGQKYPRVVGLLLPSDARPVETIRYVKGNALDINARTVRTAVIVQVVNDATPNWGGAGFSMAVLRKWPKAQDEFRSWASSELRLGGVHFAEVVDGVFVASIVAQRGYGPAKTPRIRYGALEEGIHAIAQFAAEKEASVHMPRIGCGQAGGRWDVIREIIASAFAPRETSVTVYDLPDRPITPPSGQLELGSAAR